MKHSRALIAAIAAPLAVSLAACSSSSTTANLTGQSASIRFVDGSPDAGNLDLYYVPTGGTVGATPQATVAYGAIQDFQSEPATAAQVVLYAAGTKASPKASCSIPQLTNNGLYSIVVSGQVANQTLQCTLFQDTAFNANGQIRFHHASPAAAAAGLGSVAYGFYTPPFSATASLGTVGVATFPGFATAGGAAQNAFATVSVVNVTSTSQPVGIAAGANPANASNTFFGAVSIDASKLVNPGSTTQADSAGTIPGPTANNGSVFAVDCGTNATTPQGTACASGVGLLGTFDSK
jgi:hypothetical protein